METPEEKYNYVLWSIKNNLISGLTHKMIYFDKDDFEEYGFSQGNFYILLKRLENEGFLEDVEIVDQDDYEDDPQRSPGLYQAVISKNFDELYKKLHNNFNQSFNKKTKLNDKKIEFDNEKAVITFDNQIIQLPPYKDEHCLCRVMFLQCKGKEPVDWSIIYEEMVKLEVIDKEKNKRMVQDTMYRLNRRIKKIINTDDDLFTWQGKTIRRNY